MAFSNIISFNPRDAPARNHCFSSTAGCTKVTQPVSGEPGSMQGLCKPPQYTCPPQGLYHGQGILEPTESPREAATPCSQGARRIKS